MFQEAKYSHGSEVIVICSDIFMMKGPFFFYYFVQWTSPKSATYIGLFSSLYSKITITWIWSKCSQCSVNKQINKKKFQTIMTAGVSCRLLFSLFYMTRQAPERCVYHWLLSQACITHTDKTQSGKIVLTCGSPIWLVKSQTNTKGNVMFPS